MEVEEDEYAGICNKSHIKWVLSKLYRIKLIIDNFNIYVGLVSELKMVLERQNTLRPIFESLFRGNRRERQHASPLRRLLAEAGIEYAQLQVRIL